MKSKKPRPRENDFTINTLDKGSKQVIFKNYFKEMEEKTEEFIIKNPQLFDTKFYLFQSIKLFVLQYLSVTLMLEIKILCIFLILRIFYITFLNIQ